MLSPHANNDQPGPVGDLGFGGEYLCLTNGGLQNASHLSEWSRCETKSWMPAGFCLEMALIFSAGEDGTRQLGTGPIASGRLPCAMNLDRFSDVSDVPDDVCF